MVTTENPGNYKKNKFSSSFRTFVKITLRNRSHSKSKGISKESAHVNHNAMKIDINDKR